MKEEQLILTDKEEELLDKVFNYFYGDETYSAMHAVSPGYRPTLWYVEFLKKQYNRA